MRWLKILIPIGAAIWLVLAVIRSVGDQLPAMDGLLGAVRPVGQRASSYVDDLPLNHGDDLPLHSGDDLRPGPFNGFDPVSAPEIGASCGELALQAADLNPDDRLGRALTLLGMGLSTRDGIDGLDRLEYNLFRQEEALKAQKREQLQALMGAGFADRGRQEEVDYYMRTDPVLLFIERELEPIEQFNAAGCLYTLLQALP